MSTRRPDEEHHLLRPFGEEVALEKGRAISEKLHEKQLLELKIAGLKAQAAAIKEQIEGLNGAALALKDDIRMGKHLVPVQCKWSMDTDHWRLITEDGEVIRTEKTTMADRQAELSLS